jgi:hypothetical protein
MNDDHKSLENERHHISSSPDVARRVRDLIRVSAEAVGSNMGALFLLDESCGVFKIGMSVNLPEEYIAACGDISVGSSAAGGRCSRRRLGACRIFETVHSSRRLPATR